MHQVCWVLRSISIEPTIWAAYFENLILRTTVLVFDEITDPIIRKIIEPCSQEFYRLGRAIVQGERLRREWGPALQQNNGT